MLDQNRHEQFGGDLRSRPCRKQPEQTFAPHPYPSPSYTQIKTMSLIEQLTGYISNQTSPLSPITLPPLPVASIQPLSWLIEHLTSTPVHPTYYPFARFGVIHAARVATVWADSTKGKDRRKVGVLQDLVGFLVMSCMPIPSYALIPLAD